MAHEVTLHVAFVHSFVNPALFLVLHRWVHRERRRERKGVR
jgi:hypothetical protein